MRPGRPAASDRTSRAAMCAQLPSRGRQPSTTATSDAACGSRRRVDIQAALCTRVLLAPCHKGAITPGQSAHYC